MNLSKHIAVILFLFCALPVFCCRADDRSAISSGPQCCITESTSSTHNNHNSEQPIEERSDDKEKEKENEIEAKRKTDDDHCLSLLNAILPISYTPSLCFYLSPETSRHSRRLSALSEDIPVYILVRDLRV